MASAMSSGIDTSLAVVGDQPGLHACQGRLAGALVPEHVGLVAHDQFISLAAPGQGGNEVAHRAAGSEQAGLLAQQGGCPVLELVDRRVFSENVVADFGGGHGPAHLVGWLRNGVAAQVDRCHLALYLPLCDFRSPAEGGSVAAAPL